MVVYKTGVTEISRQHLFLFICKQSKHFDVDYTILCFLCTLAFVQISVTPFCKNYIKRMKDFKNKSFLYISFLFLKSFRTKPPTLSFQRFCKWRSHGKPDRCAVSARKAGGFSTLTIKSEIWYVGNVVSGHILHTYTKHKINGGFRHGK